MKKILWTLLLLAGTILLYGQTGLGTAGQQEYARALTNGGHLGAIRITTAVRDSERPCNTSNLGGIIWNTTTGSFQTCDGSTWATLGVAGALALGTAVSGGAANRVLFEDASQLLAADADFTFLTDTLTATKGAFPTSATIGTTTTAGTATCVIDGAMGGTSTTDNFFRCQGTTPTTLTAGAYAARYDWSTAGSSSSAIVGVGLFLTPGYTGSSGTHGLLVHNTVAGTGVGTVGNVAITSTAFGSTTGGNVAGNFGAFNSSTFNLGVTGIAVGTGDLNVGVAGQVSSAATVHVGGLFRLFNSSTITGYSKAALIADNDDQSAGTADIFQARETGAIVGVIQDGGSTWEKIGTKTLVDATATGFVRVAVPSNGRQGGMVFYCVDANDATNYQTRCGSIPFTLVNEAGTEACTVGTPADSDGTPTGTLTVSFDGINNAADTCDLRANATSSLTETTLRIDYHVRLFGNAATAATAL